MLRQKLPEKLTKRVQLLRRNKVRRAIRKKESQLKEQKWDQRHKLTAQSRTIVKQLLSAREARNEDWERGPLAPRRDVGDKANSYGTIEGQQAQVVKRIENMDRNWRERFLSPEQRMRKHGWSEIDRRDFPGGCEKGLTCWEKKGNYFVKGDRVVVTRGPNMGKIGEITEVHRSADMVSVGEINKAEYIVPDWMRKYRGYTNTYDSHDMAIPTDDVRLVARVWKAVQTPEGESTKEKKEVIVDQMVMRCQINKDGTQQGGILRLIPGSEWKIRKRKREKKDDVPDEYGPDDTLRITTEDVSFVPSLVNVPMPTSVIDELRNPYSKFRTRHTDDYIAKMAAQEEAEKMKKEAVTLMKTPLKHFNTLGKAAVKSEAKRRIEERGSDEKIGEAVWRHLTAAKKAHEARV